MNIKHATAVHVQTDIVVMGTNPEMADYTNPRGYLYGYRGYVIAEANDGSRWVFHRTMSSYLEAEVMNRLSTFVAHVQKKLDAGRALDPQYWQETRPGYGSDAYIRGGWSAIDAAEERAMEE